MASMDDLLGSLDDQAKQKKRVDDKVASSTEAAQNTDKIVSAVDKNTQSTTDGLKSIKGDVTVTNPDLAKSQDVNQAVEAINKLNLTTFMQNEGLPQLASNLSDLSSKTQDLQDKLENEGLKKMSDQLGLVVKKLDEVSKVLSKTEISVDAKLQKTIDNLSKSINAIDFKPTVNVTSPATKVVTTPVDFKPILTALASVEQAIKDSGSQETENIDLSPVTSGLSSVQNAITALRFPVPNYVLPFATNTGKATQVTLDGSGNLPVIVGGTVIVDDLAAAPTGSAVPANAQYQGNLAQTALPTAASAGNLTGALADKFGRTVVLPGGFRDIIGSQRTTITASTSETTIVTAAASIFADNFLLTFKNTSATAVRVDIRDTTAGTIIDDIYLPAGDTRGWAIPQGVMAQTSVNTNWTAQCSASVTDVRCTAWFFKNK